MNQPAPTTGEDIKRDAWLLYDPPHVEDTSDLDRFALFAASDSTTRLVVRRKHRRLTLVCLGPLGSEMRTNIHYSYTDITPRMCAADAIIRAARMRGILDDSDQKGG